MAELALGSYMAAVQVDFQFGSAPFICFIPGVFLVPANENNDTSLQNPAYHNDIKHSSAAIFTLFSHNWQSIIRFIFVYYVV